jgi:hypothetical protein
VAIMFFSPVIGIGARQLPLSFAAGFWEFSRWTGRTE